MDIYEQITQAGLDDSGLPKELAHRVLTDQTLELLPLLNAAYKVRQHYVGQEVTIHIINNAQNGFCPEDCAYCAQAKSSKANIEEYPLKSEDEFLAEAKNAHDKGAHRYCMVFAGRGPSKGRVEKLSGIIRKIKDKYPLEICVSAGLLDHEKAEVLKNAGLDRLNHNLNTSEKHYPSICSTHTYQDRRQTLQAARDAGIQLCSGVILGMKEKEEDVMEVAYELRKLKAESIPVNFFIPIKGNALEDDPELNPQYCLRALCVYRFLNPKAEIRIAAGRELHLRSMEVMALYPANSLFLDGYLNTKGNERLRTLQMIQDAGFTISSNIPLEELIEAEKAQTPSRMSDRVAQSMLKDVGDLRPAQ